MAYDPSRMSLLGPASGGMLWSYDTPDGKAAVQLVSYFASIARVLDVGDRIHCNAAGVFFDLAVSAIAGTNVSTVATINYA